MSNRRRVVGVPIVAAVAACLVAGPASAAPTDNNLDAKKAAAHKAITNRLAVLSAEGKRVDANTYLSSAHRDALHALINTATQGLTTLDAKIQSDTDRATLRADMTSIVRSYRVDMLVKPQVGIVCVSDAELAAADKFDAALTTINQRLDAIAAKGVDVTQARAAVTSARTVVADARAKATAAASSALALTAGTWTDASRSTLNGDLRDVRSSREDLRSAHQAVEKAVKDLPRS